MGLEGGVCALVWEVLVGIRSSERCGGRPCICEHVEVSSWTQLTEVVVVCVVDAMRAPFRLAICCLCTWDGRIGGMLGREHIVFVCVLTEVVVDVVCGAERRAWGRNTLVIGHMLPPGCGAEAGPLVILTVQDVWVAVLGRSGGSKVFLHGLVQV